MNWIAKLVKEHNEERKLEHQLRQRNKLSAVNCDTKALDKLYANTKQHVDAKLLHDLEIHSICRDLGLKRYTL